jgi:hypothetical protein
LFYCQSKQLLQELNERYPAYVEFRKNLDRVNNRLSGIIWYDQVKPDTPVKQRSSILSLLLHIGLGFCSQGMNAAFGCYKTQRYTATHLAVHHSGFGSPVGCGEARTASFEKSE